MPFELETARMYLKQEFEYIDTIDSPEKLTDLLQKESFDVIMLDMNFRKGEMDGREGIQWLGYILSNDPLVSVIMITAYGYVNVAVDAIKAGATGRRL